MNDGLKHDRQESDPKLRRIIKKAEREAKEALSDYPPCIGFSTVLWEKQQQILKQKYGINWKTPYEMNPDVCFD
jgi:hypothetical protein